MLNFEILKEKSNEPKPDLAVCHECDWHGKVEECDSDIDGDWESGYYTIDICPKCGGCIEYDMSKERGLEWFNWFKNQKRKGK